MVNGFLIFAAAVGGWILFLVVLQRRGLLERLGMSLMGPFLMLKTVRGRRLIDRISRWRGIALLGRAYVGLIAVTMVGMTLLLIWIATLVPSISADQAPAPELLLGLPGVNPVIPITYGIFGLAVAIIVHEFSHGVLARRWKVKIRSLGLLLFVVPIGAFVEPEEDELKALDRRQRGTVYAAGPGSNVVLAVAMALLFSLGMMGAVQAKAPGMGITDVVEGAPADGILEVGGIITAVDGVPVPDAAAFSEVLGGTEAGQRISLTVYEDGSTQTVPLTLANRADFTNRDVDEGRGYVGVATIGTSTDIFNPLEFRKSVGLGSALLLYTFLPFQGLSPIQPPLTDFYEVTGAWGALPYPLFWILANAVYWLFWINLMLGMTNALPAVPLDGGYLVRDWLDAALKRLRVRLGAEAREIMARNVSYLIALFILGLILWQLIGPRL